jgi:SAM-dependent methyltransferase
MLRTVGELAYRAGALARPSDVPDHGLRDFVATHDPGRALDIGCGAGRNALVLATSGWDTTGVEILGSAVADARSAAEARGLNVRFIQGDVTELPTLGIGENFQLLMDGGCYHMIPTSKRDAYARSVSAVAATGATLIMVGFTRHLAFGMGRDELIKRFVGWQLVDAQPIPGEQMHQYICGPRLMRTALRHGRFRPWRYRFERSG